MQKDNFSWKVSSEESENNFYDDHHRKIYRERGEEESDNPMQKL